LCPVVARPLRGPAPPAVGLGPRDAHPARLVHDLLPFHALLERGAVGRHALVGGIVHAELAWQIGGEPAAQLASEGLLLGRVLEVHGRLRHSFDREWTRAPDRRRKSAQGMMMDRVLLPALNPISSRIASASSTSTGRPKRFPKGGTAPGTQPVSASSSSGVAKRSVRVPRMARTLALSTRRLPGSTTCTGASAARSTNALAPDSMGVPRTCAASALVNTGACSNKRKRAPAAFSHCSSRSVTAVPIRGSIDAQSGPMRSEEHTSELQS